MLALLVQQALGRLLAGGLQALLRVLPLPGGRLLVAAPPARFAACAPPMSHAVEASAATTAMEIFPAAAATLRVQHVALMKHSRTKNAHAALSLLKPGTSRITRSMPLVQIVILACAPTHAVALVMYARQ